ncbi:putative transposase [Rhodococcus opacus B4]|uniref:Putative transposase n=1 Tax=Rhodococcus opacus (strain B4) TaxID=632772 RepID=C1B451_RHOOB|nr:putative transposase [Rhodococcus opacus B4]
MTDIATGWTENRSVRNKARKWVIAALDEIAKIMPFEDPGRGQRQRFGIHQSSPPGVVRETEDHLHPVAARQLQRRLPRGAEELGDRAHRRRLPPLRHRSRTGVAGQDLGAAVAAGELLLPAAETRLEGPQRREGRQEVRHGDHPTPPRRTPRSGRETRQGDPCRHLRPAEPCSPPAPDPGTDHRTAHDHHQQGRAGQTPPLHARTLT